MSKELVRIKKSDLPKKRRKWQRRPETQVKPSKKLYRRGRAKTQARKMIQNAKSQKNS